jgi:nucleoside-diphosphate-sugar epimerase
LSGGRFIVTGATGFLGGALVRKLLAGGHEVVALGRQAEALLRLLRDGAQAIRCDLVKQAALPEPIAADVFVHCAALSSPWGRGADFHAANVMGTHNALAMAKAAGVKRFVHVSTPSLYFRFQNQIALREDAPLPPPVNAYAATKRQAEELVLRQDTLDPIILRPRGIYGAGDTALMPRLLRVARRRALPLMRGGRAATDLTHVDDVVDALIVAANAGKVSQRLFNVSGGVALNVREVIERVGERAGVSVRWRSTPAPVVLGAVRLIEGLAKIAPGRPEPLTTAYSVALLAYTQTLDIGAAKAVLGWTPRIGFEEGLTRTFQVQT